MLDFGSFCHGMDPCLSITLPKQETGKLELARRDWRQLFPLVFGPVFGGLVNLVLDVANRFLALAFCLFQLAFSFELAVAGDNARNFLSFAFCLFSEAFCFILTHHNFLSGRLLHLT